MVLRSASASRPPAERETPGTGCVVHSGNPAIWTALRRREYGFRQCRFGDKQRERGTSESTGSHSSTPLGPKCPQGIKFVASFCRPVNNIMPITAEVEEQPMKGTGQRQSSPGPSWRIRRVGKASRASMGARVGLAIEVGLAEQLCVDLQPMKMPSGTHLLLNSFEMGGCCALCLRSSAALFVSARHARYEPRPSNG